MAIHQNDQEASFVKSHIFVHLPEPRRAVQLVLGAALGAIIGANGALAGDIVRIESLGPGAPAHSVDQGLVANKGIAANGKATKLQLGLDTLAEEVAAFQAAAKRGLAKAQTFTTQKTKARIVDNRVLIEAVATGDDPEQLAADLRKLGATVTATFGRTVSASLPVGRLSDLRNLSSLRFARPAMAMTHVGLVTTQGDEAQRSDEARSNFAVDGSGEAVGVMSDSFDCTGDGGGYSADQANGDLPAGVNILDDLTSDCSDEGRAMAQIVYDVAPGSDLAFHTAIGGQAVFAQGILDLGNAGATVIVDDIIYFAEPMFQDGIIAQAVDQVTANGVAYFSSAGNSGRQSYEAPFRPSGQFADFGFGSQELHDFDPDPTNTVTWQQFDYSSGGDVPMVLQWDQPHASAGGAGSASDIDFCVNSSPTAAGAFCSAAANFGGDPVEGFTLNPDTATLYFAIPHFSGPYPDLVKYVWFADAISNLAFATDSPTSYGHANAAGAISVGAAFYQNTPEFGQDPPLLESFSSAGGVPILFDPAGNPISESRDTPDFTAPDGGDTTFFSAVTGDIDGTGFPNFFGTSASAPHAAGVAALMRDVEPALPADQVAAILRNTAVDILTRDSGEFVGGGTDDDSGTGLIDADAALAQTVPSPGADLAAFTSDASDPVQPGDTLVYTADFFNFGPGTASNVVLTDTLPGGVTLVSAVSLTGNTACSETSPGIVACTAASIGSGVVAFHDITVTIDPGTVGVITNNVTVTSNTADPDPINNAASEDTTVNPPDAADLAIAKSDDQDPIVIDNPNEANSNRLTYTVTVTNNGPDEALGVVATDTLPPGATLVSTSGCAEDPNGVPTCSLGSLASGANAAYTIVVDLAPGTFGVLSNQASVASATNDPVPDNDSTSEDTQVSLFGDQDGDGCIGRSDVIQLLTDVRAGNTDPQTQDINADGVVNRADARALIQLYTDPSGVCGAN